MVLVGSRGDAKPNCALAQGLLKQNRAVDLFFATQQSAKLDQNLSTSWQLPSSLYLPFTNADFYEVIHKSTRGKEHPNPWMKSVGMVADVMRHLVLPCFLKQVLQDVANDCDML
jgi:hypothetical protein